MRILNVTQTYYPFFEYGGPPEKVRALSEGLVRLGHEVTVLTADWGLERRLAAMPGEPPAGNSPFGKKREVNGVKAIYLPNWLHYRAASWNPALPRYLRARLGDFDVVHVFGLYDLLGVRAARAAAKRKIPYVAEPIGMFVPIVRSLRLKRLYRRAFGQKMLMGAAAIIATAEQEKGELISGDIPAEKIVLRRNGVSPPAQMPPGGSFRKSLHVPQDAKLVLFLGRLSKKKSPDLLLQAFAQLAGARRSDLHLAFVGPDESGMLARLKRVAGELGVTERVHFSDPLEGDAKWAAYGDADIFVLPSQNENFGNTAAESVAASTPVIVTDQCGIAPLLDGAGLVVSHSLNSLTQGLASLLDDDALRERLKKGCAAALGRLDWESPAREMDLLFQTLAGPARS